jgi:hypothetical protein
MELSTNISLKISPPDKKVGTFITNNAVGSNRMGTLLSQWTYHCTMSSFAVMLHYKVKFLILHVICYSDSFWVVHVAQHGAVEHNHALQNSCLVICYVS